jgi:signal transduction histidine kinase
MPAGSAAVNRILVVEDDPGISGAVAAELEHEGYETLLAGDGPSALRAWREWEPHLTAALEAVEQATLRATRIVTDLLALARLDREPALNRTLLSLDDLVLRAVREAQTLRREVPIRVTHLDEATVSGDPFALAQLLINLLDNALAVSPPGSEIEAAMVAGSEVVTISVSDRGPGIAVRELDRIFDRFYTNRAQNTPGQRPSAGLGLAIARGIARGHGGELTAGNRPDGGATFVLTLPLAGGTSGLGRPEALRDAGSPGALRAR